MTTRIPLPLSTLHSLLGLSGMMVEDVTVFVDVEEYNRLMSDTKGLNYANRRSNQQVP